MPNGRKLRVLVLAEACNPRWSSVPLVGYNMVKALAARPDLEVTLVSQVRNRDALEADGLSSIAEIHYIDNEFIARRIGRLGHLLRGGGGLSWTTATALEWPSYMVFERMVYRRFDAALRRGDFDLIHRVTPVSPTLGSPLAGLTPVPMILGPLNGGLPWPKAHPGLRRREREWLVPLRRAYRWMPYHRSTYRHLAAVIAGSQHTAAEVPAGFRGLRYYLPENGIDPGRFPEMARPPRPTARFRFITVGRLVPYKGMDLIVEAMARSECLRDTELVIVGDGPQRASLEALARDTGLGRKVRFSGWLEQGGVAGEMGQAQAFVFPSLREFGGAVVLEAMASGLPIIVVDYGGPGELATPECGIKIPMAPRNRLVPALAAAMEQLASDPAFARRLGEAGRRKAHAEFTWDAKAERLAAIYRQVSGAVLPRR